MSAWIESHKALERHPKTLSLMSFTGWDLDSTLGKLHRFWWWCVDYAESGDLRKHNDASIASAVGLNGDTGKDFIDAMVRSGWIDRNPYFRVHDWWDYIGSFLQVRYKHYPDKWQAIRESYRPSKKNRSKNGSKNGVTNQTKPNQPTNKGAGDFSDLIPPALDSPEFRSAWSDWSAHRHERGPKLTKTAAEKQIKKLCALGRTRAIAAIEHSMAGSYQGIFEERDGAAKSSGKAWSNGKYLPG